MLAGKYEEMYEYTHTYVRIRKPWLNLLDNSEMELKVELKGKGKLNDPEEMEKYVISFLIVFEMPPMQSSEYVDRALPQLCKTMSYLPYSALARICRVWARYCRDSFTNILDSLQQLITMRTIKNYDSTRRLQENADIISATKVMKVSGSGNGNAALISCGEKVFCFLQNTYQFVWS